jgi:hypothetical protein
MAPKQAPQQGPGNEGPHRATEGYTVKYNFDEVIERRKTDSAKWDTW